MHRKDMGKWGESKVVTAALDRGCPVFLDYGDNSRTDMIIEDNTGGLHKIQVKTVSREKGASKLLLYKNGPGYRFKYESGMVDYFALVDYKTGNVAWIQGTPELYKLQQVTLRHERTKNNQIKNIRWFNDYIGFPFPHEKLEVKREMGP